MHYPVYFNYFKEPHTHMCCLCLICLQDRLFYVVSFNFIGNLPIFKVKDLNINDVALDILIFKLDDINIFYL